MSLKTDIVNLVVRVNGDNAKKEMNELKARAAEITAELKKMKKGTEEYEAKSKELALVQSRFKALRGEMDLNSLSIKDLRQEIAKMKSIRNELDPSSESFKTLGDRIFAAERRMRNLTQGGNFLSRTFEFLKKEAMSFGVVMLGALGIDYVIGKIGNLIQKNAELSDSLTSIRKNTGLSQEAVEELNKSLSKVDTRTAKKNLLDIASGLGQVGEEPTLDSIQNLDKIIVSLGDEFGKSSKEITTELSILRNNFDEFKGGDYGQNMLNIGNALNYLGATGIATAPVVTDFSTRMSGVLNQFGVGAGKTLGLSAAMQELGINIERGSTAVTRLVQKMAQNPEVFAKVAGAKTKKEIKEFIDLLNNDAIGALLKVAKGAKDAGDSNTEFASILKELESTGAGVGEVLSKFAANQELVNQRIVDGTKAIQENNSINNEFALMNDNLAGKVEKLQKRFASFFVSDKLKSWAESGIDKINSLMDSFSNLVKWIDRNEYWIKSLVAAYLVYYIASGRLIALKTIEIAISKAKTLALIAENFAVNAIVLSLRILTREITLAAAAQKLFGSATSALSNPIGLALGAVVGLTLAITGYVDSIKQAKREADEAFANKKLEADIKYRTETFKAENAAILEDLKSNNKAKLKIDQDALDAANEIRNEEIKKLKSQLTEKQKLVDDVDDRAGFFGGRRVYDTKQKKLIMPADLDNRKALRDIAKEALEEAEKNQNQYIELRKLVSEKLIDIDSKQQQFDAEMTSKQKAELEKRKRDYAKYLADLKRYKQELQDFYDKVEQAKIDVIEEEKAKDLAALDFKYKLENEKILAQTNTLVGESRNLKQSAEEQRKIVEQSKFLQLDLEKKYQEDRKAIIQKYEDEIKKGSYTNEINAINDFIASQKLLFGQLYRDQVIDKNTYDNQLENLDISAKAKLLDVAKRYGIDVTKAAQDLTNAEINIMANALERKKALLKREADFRVQLAEYNQGKNPSKSNLAEVYNAQIIQLGINLQNEIDLVKGGEEEKLQIYKEYNLKRQQLDDEYKQKEADLRRDEITEKGNAVMQYAQIANDYAQQIFDFRRQKFQDELNVAQETYNKENSSLDEQYKNRLISDIEYNNRKKEIQAKLDKEQRALKRKQAVNDKIAAIFNIGISTGQAIMSALSAPWPASIAFAALAGAMGATQLGMVAAKEIPQFADGGYTKKKVIGAQDGKTYDARIKPGFEQGYLSNPSLVLAGEQGEEYFVNNTMLKNPTVKYVVDGIDALSKGNMSYPDFQAMLALPALQQKYTGGYVGSTSTNTPVFKQQDNTKDIYTEVLMTVAKEIGRLSDHLDDGIKAEARIGDKTIVDFEQRQDYLKNIVDDAN